MRRLDSVPVGIIEQVQDQHQRALRRMQNAHDKYAEVPARAVKMRIDRPSESEMTLERVIVPGVSISAPTSAFLDEEKLLVGPLTFHLAGSPLAYPLAHIFQGSGTICLGNIPVPQQISRYSPLTPLDTLFLYNDHHTAHGGANLTVKKPVIDYVIDMLEKHDIRITPDIKMTFKSSTNLIANDALWILSAEVVKQSLTLDTAFAIMENIFYSLFNDIDFQL